MIVICHDCDVSWYILVYLGITRMSWTKSSTPFSFAPSRAPREGNWETATEKSERWIEKRHQPEIQLPSSNQTWLAGRYTIWFGDFPGQKPPLKHGISQPAMFDYPRVFNKDTKKMELKASAEMHCLGMVKTSDDEPFWKLGVACAYPLRARVARADFERFFFQYSKSSKACYWLIVISYWSI